MARQMLQKSAGKDALCFTLGASSYVRACGEHLYLGVPPKNTGTLTVSSFSHEESVKLIILTGLTLCTLF